jgi:transposase-like protein
VWVTVAIVWPCPLGVEQYAAAGRQIEVPRPDCPGCGRAMGLWSGYARWVRVGGRVWRVWVRRSRCGSCRVTHALLPSFVLARRVDVVEVIGAALERAAAGVGLRPIAAWLGVPYSTVRDWRRRFVRRAGLLAAGLGALAVEVGAALPRRVADLEGAVLGVLGAIWARVGQRLGWATPGRWQLAALLTGGGWLGATTSPPWAGRGGPGWMPPVPDPP